MGKKGIQWFKIKFQSRDEEIGFFYYEVVWNLLEEVGKVGLTVATIRQKTGMSEQSIRNVLRDYIKMRRVKRLRTKPPDSVPIFKYIIKRRWLNVI